MLGLLKGTVKLLEHQESWNHKFQDIKIKLLSAIDNQVIEIQHIGSTSVKNIPAKPILDIAILIADISKFEELKKPIEALGYEYRGDKGQRGGELFVLEISPGVRSQHLHIVDVHDPQWEKWIKFRDYLNANPQIARQYGKIKRDLADKYAESRVDYTRSKDDFVNTIIHQIMD